MVWNGKVERRQYAYDKKFQVKNDNGLAQSRNFGAIQNSEFFPGKIPPHPYTCLPPYTYIFVLVLL